MDRNFAMEFVRVTEAAAIASARLMGKGDKIGADQAAVDAMRTMLNRIAIDGEIVIGEGEIDEAPGFICEGSPLFRKLAGEGQHTGTH